MSNIILELFYFHFHQIDAHKNVFHKVCFVQGRITFIGDPELLAILTAVKTRMGSIALAHIEDICHAHIFLMENIKAEGRYICCAKSWTMPTVIGELKKEYPCPALERLSIHFF